MQHVNCLFKSDCINGAISVAIEIVDQFKNARASVVGQYFGSGGGTTLLNEPKVMTNEVFDFARKLTQIFLAALDPDKRLLQS